LLAGLALTTYLVATWARPDVVALAVFCLAAGVGELLRVRVTSESVSLSLSLVVMMAAVVALGPAGAALTAVSAAVVAGVGLRPRPEMRKTLFNIGLFALGGGASGLAYQAFGGQVGQVHHAFSQRDFWACAAAAAANFAVNWPLVITIVHLTTGKSV